MARPLAERLRPNDFDGFVGQKHLVGEGAVLLRGMFVHPPFLIIGMFTSRR